MPNPLPDSEAEIEQLVFDIMALGTDHPNDDPAPQNHSEAVHAIQQMLVREKEQAYIDNEYRSCTVKVKHTRESAQEKINFLATVKKKAVKGLSAYKCNYCEGWHLTSNELQQSSKGDESGKA